MAETMAVLDSLGFEFFHGDHFVFVRDDGVAPKHGGCFPTTDLHHDRFGDATVWRAMGKIPGTGGGSGANIVFIISTIGQDFSVGASGAASATVTPGQTATYTIALAPAGGFSQTITLSCGGR